MKARTKLLILLGASILIMAAVAIWQAYRQRPAGKPGGMSASAGVEAMNRLMSQNSDTIPSASNVSDQYREQVDGLKKRLHSMPDDTTHLIRLAELYQDGHQPDKAIPEYTHYLKLHPRNHQAWLDLVSCYGKQSDWKGALRGTENLLKAYPDDAFGLYNLGAIHANMGQFQAAREIWTKLSNLNDNPHVSAMAKQSLQQLDQMSNQATNKSN